MPVLIPLYMFISYYRKYLERLHLLLLHSPSWEKKTRESIG